MADILETEEPTLTKERVREALERVSAREQGETYDIMDGFSGGALTGYVVRTEFRGVSAAKRQQWLNEFFEDRFGSQARQIGLVLTFTPEEFEGWLEDQDA